MGISLCCDGHVEILQYAYGNGCPKDASIWGETMEKPEIRENMEEQEGFLVVEELWFESHGNKQHRYSQESTNKSHCSMNGTT
jgi:hypothetical protein